MRRGAENRMRTDPFSDTLMWLTEFRWEVAIFLLLLIGSIVVAGVNWRTDPAQRTTENVAIWVFRLLIGAMWYQGTTWKLPLPYSEAFAHWLGETGQHAAFPFVRDSSTAFSNRRCRSLAPSSTSPSYSSRLR